MVFKTSFRTISLIFVTLFSLSGCLYRHSGFILAPPYEGTEKTVKQVSIRLRLLRDFECASLFGRRLVSRGLQPLQMYIQNNSNKTYELNGERISVPLEGKRSVGKHLYHRSTGRTLVWLFGTVMIYWPVFLPLLVLDSMYGIHVNNMVRRDIDAICLNPKQKLLIPPNTKTHKIIFFDPEEYSHHLVVTLKEHDSDELLTFAF